LKYQNVKPISNFIEIKFLYIFMYIFNVKLNVYVFNCIFLNNIF